jgi:hypothetical protein
MLSATSSSSWLHNPLINKSVLVTKRNDSPRNKEMLRQSLSNINWSPLYHANTCEEKFNIFQQVMNIAVDTCLPFHSVRRNLNDLPWVTDKFRSLIKKRQFYFHSGNTTLFKLYRNKVNRERKTLKKNFVKNTLDSLSQDNPRHWWKSIKSLTGIGSKHDGIDTLAQVECNGDITALANKINRCFKEVSSHISPLPATTKCHGHQIPDEYVISVLNVKQQLEKTNVRKAVGPDDIPNWILKDLSDVLAGPICSIWNSSFRDNYIPTVWKSANTCPLPKVSPPLNIRKDLRPISLTPVLSKGLEWHAREWFLKIFKPQIDVHQYGSQSECSTVIALVQLIHNWLLKLETGKYIIRILLIDFSKAFDLVDHNILIKKMSDVGTPDFLTAWVYNFLSGRQQRVKIGNQFSEWENVNAGVPQGTLLGPSAFLLHINNFKTVCNSVKYVDDTTIWESCRRDGGDSKLQYAANQSIGWCTTNNMKINTDKTKEMLIDFSKTKHDINSIMLNNDKLERVKNSKLLGVIINDKLTWCDHVKYICRKASKRIYFLRLLKRADISPSDIVHVFCSIIRSLLEYACEVWSPGLTKEQSNQIELIQKRALNIVYPDTTYEQALTMCKLTTLKFRRQERCKKFFSDICKPNHRLHDLLPPKTTVSHLRKTRTFHLPKVRTNRLKNSPIFYGVFNFQ